MDFFIEGLAGREVSKLFRKQSAEGYGPGSKSFLTDPKIKRCPLLLFFLLTVGGGGVSLHHDFRVSPPVSET